MSNDCTIRINRLANGYTVQMTDPKIVAENNKRDSKTGYTPYRNPDVSFAFDDTKQVVKFISENLDKALPMDEYDTSFKKALTSADDST